jgi:alpha-mannosidase
MPGAPQVVPSTVRSYFETLEQTAQGLPVWQGEFYLEGHRGVLTSQAWIKRANRKAEVLLHDAELARRWRSSRVGGPKS